MGVLHFSAQRVSYRPCFSLVQRSSRVPVCLFDVDAIAHHPQFKLLKTHLPAIFKLSHPPAIPGAVSDIHDDPHKVVSVENPTVTPVAFHFLCLITSRPEVIHDFENSLGDPFCWDVSSIIEP
jgi:hypothetical protein